MDEEHLERACELVDQQRYVEAYDEFMLLAENTADPVEKAWALLYAVNTLQTLGREEAATSQLSAVRKLIERHRPPSSAIDEKFAAAEAFLDFIDANLVWLRSGGTEAALARFDGVLYKHEKALKDRRAREFCEGIQIRRAFILADLGRWKEAMPLLEGIKSPQEYKEGVAFYLGHCYSSANDYGRAVDCLTQALKLGLPKPLEYKAHCELGAASYHLGEYAQARAELQMGAQMADAQYIEESQIWRWLELTCLALGLKSEAEEYAHMQNPS
jgi:tetratricopeptide (TPR) repeat protein